MNEKSNKLISLLKSLDRQQRKRCRKLVQSPWFSGNADLLAFYDEIHRRLEKGRSLDKLQIWRSVRGKSVAFNDVRFRKYTSDLFKLVQQFLVQESLEEEPELRKYLYLSALERQNPEKLIRGVERNWDRYSAEYDSDDAIGYLYQHLLERRRRSLLNYEQRPTAKANLEEISSSLDKYFIISKLFEAVNAQSRRRNEKRRYDIHLVEEVIELLDTTGVYLDTPLVLLNYYMYKMLQHEENTGYYEKYKELILQRNPEVRVPLSYEHIPSALNYCVRKITQGHQAFLKEYLEIYRFALENNIASANGVIDPGAFKNTVQIAMRAGEFDWAEHYIQHYQVQLPEKQRANSVNINSAILYFYQKNYDKAMDFLRDVEYENIYYNLNAKSMLLAIYYETDQDISLDSLLESTLAYLNRHKELPEKSRHSYANLVSFTRRLTRMMPGDERAINQLKADLAAKKYVASRPWLEKKIAEFSRA